MGSCKIKWPLRRSRAISRGWALAAVLLISAATAACNFLTAEEDPRRPPDVFDKVRAIDLLPRFPKPTGTTNTGTTAAAQASDLCGEGRTIGPSPGVVGAMQAAGGEGYELNFENTPVTTVAKVVLGDILGLGYTIDPRVQGTVTLASGRPVPRGDLLYVLESALRMSNVALVRDQAGYRLIPAGEAVGSGSIDRAAAGSGPEPGYGITVIPLQHVSAATVTKLLDSFAVKAGTIRADPARNLVLIQGSGAEPAQRGRDRAELRCRLDARPVGRDLSGAQQRARSGHRRA